MQRMQRLSVMQSRVTQSYFCARKLDRWHWWSRVLLFFHTASSSQGEGFYHPKMRQQKMVKKTLKKFLPKSFIDVIKKGRNRIDIWIASNSAMFRWTTVLYYVFYNAAFYREMSSVLNGRRKYHQQRISRGGASWCEP